MRYTHAYINVFLYGYIFRVTQSCGTGKLYPSRECIKYFVQKSAQVYSLFPTPEGGNQPLALYLPATGMGRV